MRRLSSKLVCAAMLGCLAAVALAACAPGVATEAARAAEALADATEGAVGRTAATEAGPEVSVEGAAAEAAATAPARGEAGEPVIVFRRGGGLAGRSDEWLIYADGTVQAADGTAQAVAPEAVSALLTGLEALGFFEMEAAYGRDSQCADCYQYEITVVHNGQKKTVATLDAAADAPAVLGQMIAQIQQLIGG
jgi:hypothetical protein